MIQIKGTRTALRLPDETGREAHTMAFDCPDGVDRFVTIPNWKWNVWHWPTGPALDLAEVADAWRFAQIFACRYPAADVFADHLIRNLDRVYRRAEFRASNDNSALMVFDPLRRRKLPRPRWGKGGVSSVFKRHTLKR